MKRRLLNVLTVVSLSLCVAVVALWAWSHWSHVAFWYGHVPAGEGPVDVVQVAFEFGQGNGWASVEVYRSVHDVTALLLPERGWGWDLPGDPRDPARHAEESLFGFAYDDLMPGDDTYRRLGVACPLWLPAVLFGLIPALRSRRRVRRRRRLSLGSCGACGYDMRATPGRCPECGDGSAGAKA